MFPLFLFNQMLAAFLRNDGDPGRATAAVLAGGIFNVLGDYFFVFTCDMGIFGAGLATAIGSGISFLVMLTHFCSRKNTLRLVKPEALGRKLRDISVTGFSTFFIDVAMGILTVLPFNIFSTYYFQAFMKPRAAFVVSVARGLVISGVLILLLPVLAGAEALWLAMPITEVLVMVYAAAVMRSYTAALKG